MSILFKAKINIKIKFFLPFHIYYHIKLIIECVNIGLYMYTF